MQRWFIELGEVSLEGVPSEQLELGTLVLGALGGRYLVFRDGFVVPKVARRLGLSRSPARLAAHAAPPLSPLAQHADGRVLLAEPR